MDPLLSRRRFPLAWLGLLVPLAVSAAPDPVDRLEQVATEWVKTRAETVRTETEWSGQRALMESMVSALDERARLIEEKIGHEQARTAQEREELDTLESRNGAAGAGLEAATA